MARRRRSRSSRGPHFHRPPDCHRCRSHPKDSRRRRNNRSSASGCIGPEGRSRNPPSSSARRESGSPRPSSTGIPPDQPAGRTSSARSPSGRHTPRSRCRRLPPTRRKRGYRRTASRSRSSRSATHNPRGRRPRNDRIARSSRCSRTHRFPGPRTPSGNHSLSRILLRSRSPSRESTAPDRERRTFRYRPRCNSGTTAVPRDIATRRRFLHFRPNHPQRLPYPRSRFRPSRPPLLRQIRRYPKQHHRRHPLFPRSSRQFPNRLRPSRWLPPWQKYRRCFAHRCFARRRPRSSLRRHSIAHSLPRRGRRARNPGRCRQERRPGRQPREGQSGASYLDEWATPEKWTTSARQAPRSTSRSWPNLACLLALSACTKTRPTTVAMGRS